MPLISRTMFVSLVLAFTAVAGFSLCLDPRALLAAPTPKTTTSNPGAATSEIRRIHAHFDSVLVELTARNVSKLSDAQKENRDRLVRTLAGYNARGEFPHNDEFAAPTPYFVDRRTGTLCAVAFLLESTGRRDIVNRVASANNNVWVAQLAGDTAFNSWLNVNGISLDEAARIQVPYMVGEGSPNTLTGSQETGAGVKVLAAGSVLVTGTALATGAWNALGNRHGRSQFGNIAGVTSNVLLTTLGATLFYQAQSSERTARTIGVGSTIVGTIGTVLATRSILRRPSYLAAEREKENVRRSNVETSISPIIPLDRNSGAGLSLNIRF